MKMEREKYANLIMTDHDHRSRAPFLVMHDYFRADQQHDEVEQPVVRSSRAPLANVLVAGNNVAAMSCLHAAWIKYNSPRRKQDAHETTLNHESPAPPTQGF